MKWRQLFPFLVFLIGLLLALFAGRALWTNWRDDIAARNEYADLRESFERYLARANEAEPGIGGTEVDRNGPEATPRVDLSHFSELNPDFVGWISIPGTSVDYPVVQGRDNAFYLETTFMGEWNPAGSIFMDYRARQAFDTPVTVLYGHNMRDGSMFSALPDFLDPAFLRDHAEITILTADGELLIYQIFHARRADDRDLIGTLDFNDPAAASFFESAPSGSNRFLILSTCPNDGDEHTRVLVYAALRIEG